ncbi:MAG: hypothetical protein ACLQVK_08910 [Acidimicrobiales bacterium]
MPALVRGRSSTTTYASGPNGLATLQVLVPLTSQQGQGIKTAYDNKQS